MMHIAPGTGNEGTASGQAAGRLYPATQTSRFGPVNEASGQGANLPR
jgi:hypothetical protein